jgi:purine-binding chemotaxis protein CheW
LVETAEKKPELDDGRVDLACFLLQGNVYAIEVTHLREIVHCQTVTPLPKAPALIDGVIDLRGAVVPVIDLGRVLGGEPVKESGRARIAVVQVEGLVLGMRVEAATQVVSVDAGQLEEPPALATQSGYDAVRAVLRRAGDGPILVLSMDHVLEAIYRSALPGTEKGS